MLTSVKRLVVWAGRTGGAVQSAPLMSEMNSTCRALARGLLGSTTSAERRLAWENPGAARADSGWAQPAKIPMRAMPVVRVAA